MAYTFICDLDGTFSKAAFLACDPLSQEQIQIFEEKNKKKLIQLTEACYLVFNNREDYSKTIEIENIKKNLAEIKKCANKKIIFYVATFNRGGLTNSGFISNLMKYLFTDLANDQETSIDSSHIFDFIRDPINPEYSLSANDMQWIKNIGKNLHVVMAAIRENFNSPDPITIFEVAKYFLLYKLNAIVPTLEWKGHISIIENALKKYFFFDDDENNIKLARNLGVGHVYHVDNLIPEKTFDQCLKSAQRRIHELEIPPIHINEPSIFSATSERLKKQVNTCVFEPNISHTKSF